MYTNSIPFPAAQQCVRVPGEGIILTITWTDIGLRACTPSYSLPVKPWLASG